MNFQRMTDLVLAGKRVLIREDLNVPVKNGVIQAMHVYVQLYRQSNLPLKKVQR